VSEPNIVIREYDPAWQKLFEGLRERLLDDLGGLAVAVEHVGSTAVPGLAAKPVVDIDAVVTSAEDVPLAVERLERAGYRHEGDLGIPGREAFEPPADAPWHHLYVVTAGGEELRRHSPSATTCAPTRRKRAPTRPSSGSAHDASEEIGEPTRTQRGSSSSTSFRDRSSPDNGRESPSGRSSAASS
jgi:hypothetical protein